MNKPRYLKSEWKGVRVPEVDFFKLLMTHKKNGEK